MITAIRWHIGHKHYSVVPTPERWLCQQLAAPAFTLTVGFRRFVYRASVRQTCHRRKQPARLIER